MQCRLCVSLCSGLHHPCRKTQRAPLHTGFTYPLPVAPGLATGASLPLCPIATAPQHSHKLESFLSSVDAFVVLVSLALLCFYQLPTLPGPPCQPCPHSPVIGWYNFPAHAVLSRSAGI